MARKKSAYRAAALKALEAALGGLQGDHYAAVAPALLEAVARNAPGASALGAAPDAPVRCARCSVSRGQYPEWACYSLTVLHHIPVVPLLVLLLTFCI